MTALLNLVRFPVRLLFALLALTVSITIARSGSPVRHSTNPFMKTRQFRMGRLCIEVGSPRRLGA